MLIYLLKRLVMTICVLLFVVVFLAVLVHIVPGDPAKTILGPRASPESIANVREEMDLDQPVFIQVGRFLQRAVRGDLGTDVFTRRSMNKIVAEAFPHTVALAVAGLGLAIIIGIPMGLYSATHSDSIIDRITAVLSISLINIPTYVAGLLLLTVFAVRLSILPGGGATNPNDPDSILQYLKYLILPAIALAATWIGYIARLVRTSLLEVLNENYIRAAKAEGLKERLVNYKYALKNAMIPTFSVLGMGLGRLLGGAVFVEIVFNRPGMGRLIYDAISIRNFPLVRAGVLVITFVVIIINFLVDIGYAVLDPRIKLDKARR